MRVAIFKAVAILFAVSAVVVFCVGFGNKFFPAKAVQFPYTNELPKITLPDNQYPPYDSGEVSVPQNPDEGSDIGGNQDGVEGEEGGGVSEGELPDDSDGPGKIQSIYAKNVYIKLLHSGTRQSGTSNFNYAINGGAEINKISIDILGQDFEDSGVLAQTSLQNDGCMLDFNGQSFLLADEKAQLDITMELSAYYFFIAPSILRIDEPQIVNISVKLSDMTVTQENTLLFSFTHNFYDDAVIVSFDFEFCFKVN